MMRIINSVTKYLTVHCTTPKPVTSSSVIKNLSWIEMIFKLLIAHFYCPQGSWGKVIFSQASVILFTGSVCLSACWDTTPPPGSRNPQTRHPLDQAPLGPGTPWTRHPLDLGAGTPRSRHPPGSRHPPLGEKDFNMVQKEGLWTLSK